MIFNNNSTRGHTGSLLVVHYTGVFTQEGHPDFRIHASSLECYSQHQQKYQTD